MRCQRLNSNEGKRCKRKATCYVTMHQDEQLYGAEPTWCVVAVCGHHAGTTKYKLNDDDIPILDKFIINEL